MNDDQFDPGGHAENGDNADAADRQMFAGLGRFQTGAIPVDAVLKQGRAIRTRRRVAGGGALAIAAVLSIGVPVAIAGGGSPGAGAANGGPNGTYAATSSGGRVTVNPTPFSHGLGNFSGTVDGKKWSVRFDNKNCFNILWTCGFTDLFPWDKYASLTFNSSWGLQGQPDDYTLYLDKNVARATITLQDGEVLRLQAVPTAEEPVVLFALPFGLGVSKIELYDAHNAEIAYAMPFNVQGSASVDGHWYKAGEKPAADSGSVELARFEFAPDEKTVITAYAGAAGPCVVLQAEGALGGHRDVSCDYFVPVTGSMPVAKQSYVIGDTNGVRDMGYGVVAPNIDRMELDFSDGTKGTVSIRSLGGYRFYAYSIPHGKTLTEVTAFDHAGKALPAQKNARMTGTEQKWPSPVTTR